jgi:hypothetical protein
MKYTKKILSVAVLFSGMFLASCEDASTSNEKTGDEVRVDDSTLPSTNANDYPNTRITPSDTAGANDSAKTKDTIRK